MNLLQKTGFLVFVLLLVVSAQAAPSPAPVQATGTVHVYSLVNGTTLKKDYGTVSLFALKDQDIDLNPPVDGYGLQFQFLNEQSTPIKLNLILVFPHPGDWSNLGFRVSTFTGSETVPSCEEILPPAKIGSVTNTAFNSAKCGISFEIETEGLFSISFQFHNININSAVSKKSFADFLRETAEKARQQREDARKAAEGALAGITLSITTPISGQEFTLPAGDEPMVINFNAKVEGIEGFECGKEYDCGWFWFNSGSWFEFDNSRKISVTEGGWNYTVTPKKIIFKLTPKSPGKPEVVSPEITFTVNKSAETAPTEQGFKITAVTASCKAAGPFKLADMDSLTVDYVNGKKFNVLEIWVLAPAETDHLTGPDNVKKADGFTNKEWKDAHRDRWFVLVNAGNANPEKPTGYVSGEALPVNYAAQKTMSKTIKGENYPLSGNDSLGVGQKWKPFGALQANAEYTLQEFNEYIDSLNERLDPDLRYYAVIQTSETGAYAASDTITDAARIINQCQSGETPVVTAKITQPTQTTFAYSPKMQIDFTATVNGTVPVCGEKGILCSWTVVSSASKDIKSFFYDAQNKLSIVTVSGQDISSVNANWRAGPGKYTVHFALLKDFAIAPPLAEDSLEITLTESPCASCSTILGCLMCVDKKIAETVFMTAEETARKEESMKPMPVIEKPVSSGMIEFKYGDSEPRTLALTEFTKTAITLSSGSGFDFRVGSDSGAVSVRISDKGNSVLILRLKDQSVCQETVYVTVPAVINKCGISFKAEVLPPATDNPGGDPYFKLSAFTFSDYIWPSNPATSPGELPPSKGKGTVPAGSILLTSPGKDPVSVDFAGLPAQNVVFPLTGGTATIQTTGEKWGLALSGNSNPSIQITHDGISCDAPYVYSSFNQAYSNYSCGLSFGFKKIPEANNSRYALYALTLSGLNAIFYRSYETVGPEPGYELISSPASPVTLKGTWNGSRDGLAINLEEPAQNGIEISFGKKNWAIKAIPNPINNGIDAFQITGPAGNTCKTEEKLLNNGSFSSDWVSFNAPECGIPSFEAGWNDFGTSVDLFVRNIQLNVQ